MNLGEVFKRRVQELLSKFPKVFVSPSLDIFSRFKRPFVWMYCIEQVIKLMRVKKREYDSTVVK